MATNREEAWKEAHKAFVVEFTDKKSGRKSRFIPIDKEASEATQKLLNSVVPPIQQAMMVYGNDIKRWPQELQDALVEEDEAQ